MPKFYMKKLVRDDVVRHCLDDPKVLDIRYRVLDTIEYREELVKKVSEEAREIPSSEIVDRSEVLSEIADLQNAVDALREHYGYTEAEVRTAAVSKTARKGAFGNRHYIEYVVVADDSEWVEYFRQDPAKYPES